MRADLEDDEAPVDERVEEAAVPVAAPRDAGVAEQVRDERGQALEEVVEAVVALASREDGDLDADGVGEEAERDDEGDVVDVVAGELVARGASEL